MEDDRKGPYSVLTRDDLREKMKKQIDGISQIFWLSKSDVTVLLMYLRWDSLRVSERLGENKEDLLKESGLKSVVIASNLDSSCGIFPKTGDDNDDDDDDDDDGGGLIDLNRDLSELSCGICFKTCDEINDDDLISTPFCSHKFCTICWREYLEKNFYSREKNQTVISCPDQDCRAAVGPDTVEKLTVRDEEMYERYILRSYLEENKVLKIKLCPAPDCNYVIEFHEDEKDEDYSLNVVCLCGHTFCWRCKLESHRPVTCNNASDWLFRDLKNLEESDKPLSCSWIETNTKHCPNCLCSVNMDGKKYRQFLTCACRYCFCSKCLRSKEVHKTESGFFGACVEPETLWRKLKVEMSCLDSWKASQISMEEAKYDLQEFDEYIIKKQSILKEQDIRILREGLMLIMQCRQVLKWICVHDYSHAEYETSKKEFLRFLQENASDLVQSYSETLREETERAFSATTFEELCNLRYKLSTVTRNIGNYFYHFIKTLQDGLVDVKVKSYDNVAGPYWFCDRCTYGNTWLRMECEMCCDATATSPEENPSD